MMQVKGWTNKILISQATKNNCKYYHVAYPMSWTAF